MAVTWEVKITPIDVSTKSASITAVRNVADDADPNIILETETHTIIQAIIGTSAQKAAVLNSIWDHHLAHKAKQIAIDNYLGGLEAAAKSNLESREG